MKFLEALHDTIGVKETLRLSETRKDIIFFNAVSFKKLNQNLILLNVVKVWGLIFVEITLSYIANVEPYNKLTMNLLISLSF